MYLSCRCHDFCPSYGRLREIRALVTKGTPLFACTATVTQSHQQQWYEMGNVVSTFHTGPNIPDPSFSRSAAIPALLVLIVLGEISSN